MTISGAKKRGKKFQNPIPTTEPSGADMFSILREYITNKAENTPKKQIGPFQTDIDLYQKPPATGLRITLIGHSSLLLEIDGKRILTDPVLERPGLVPILHGAKKVF